MKFMCLTVVKTFWVYNEDKGITYCKFLIRAKSFFISLMQYKKLSERWFLFNLKFIERYLENKNFYLANWQ